MPDFTTEKERQRQQFTTIVLTDVLPKGSSLPIFLPTETPANQSSSIDRAVELLVTCTATKICIIDNLGPSRPGYLGAEVWIEEFRNRNVTRNNLALVPFTGKLLTTLTEAFAMVECAQEHNCRELAIVAPESHLVRCMLSIITATLTLRANLKVFAQVGTRLRMFGERVQHSQNRWFTDRNEITGLELESIERYMTEGTPVPLASYAAALAYLEWRDTPK